MQIKERIQELAHRDTTSGQLLLLATILALMANNSPLSSWYDQLLDLPVSIQFGAFVIAKPLLLWINDGLMAIFFFLVGLEIKREVLNGQLSSWQAVALPAFAAAGGMLFPALIYSYINWGDATAMSGWAIPSATDIAFALGILALLGNRVPVALKVFLLTLAVIDDMGAVVIIALFYSGDISTVSLAVASISLFLLFILNRSGVTTLGPYLIVGLVLWASVLKSGVHATLAGLILAFFIPLRHTANADESTLVKLEHSLKPWVAFAVLPLFAFTNAGLSFEGMSVMSLFDPVPLGIILGLYLGNPIGILLMSWLAIRLKLAVLPKGVNWTMLAGTSLLCGVGFTMSLFIGGLAFEHTGVDQSFGERLGILTGSLLSALTGYFFLRWALTRHERETAAPKGLASATS